MKITTRMLRKKKACKDQIEKFESIFPDGAIVNEKNINLAISAGLNITWAAHHLLPRKASNEYERIKDKAYDKYDNTVYYERINGEALDKLVCTLKRACGRAFLVAANM